MARAEADDGKAMARADLKDESLTHHCGACGYRFDARDAVFSVDDPVDFQFMCSVCASWDEADLDQPHRDWFVVLLERPGLTRVGSLLGVADARCAMRHNRPPVATVDLTELAGDWSHVRRSAG